MLRNGAVHKTDTFLNTGCVEPKWFCDLHKRHQQEAHKRRLTGSTSARARALASTYVVRSTQAPAANAASVFTARRSSGATTCVTRASHLRAGNASAE